MILMRQILDVIANENVRYKCNELEYLFYNGGQCHNQVLYPKHITKKKTF